MESIYNTNSAVMNKCFTARKDYMGACRFMNNEKVDTEVILKEIQEKTNVYCAGKHVLCITDTSEYNYHSHKGKLAKDTLGKISDNRSLGIFVHPSLIVDAADLMPIGYSDINIWTRPADLAKKQERNYTKQPIEEKESNKWKQSLKASKQCLTQAQTITQIADREGDIYELFAANQLIDSKVETNAQTKVETLCRVRCNRVLIDQDVKLYAHLDAQPVMGNTIIEVKANHKIGRAKHEAAFDIKYAEVHIKRPANKNKQLPKSIKLNCIEAKEKQDTIKDGQPAVHWRLLTSHPVNNIDEALQIIEWYKARWAVEELFAITKSRGLKVEDSQFETFEALKKVMLFTFIAALKILQLTKGRKNSNQPASIIFSEIEVGLIEVLIKKYEGKTIKQQNQYEKYTLAWAAWLIGRMGGWKGYQSESPPGAKTMTRGLDKLNIMMEIWNQ